MSQNVFTRWLWLTLVALLLLASTTGPAQAAQPQQVSGLCGEGSAPDYGFSYELQQLHWTVNWEAYVAEETVNQVDIILDELEADAVAQTMILFLPASQVGDRVNCAVHFLRYMKLGLPDGERKDNGFTFLVVVGDDRIDVHYGVGLGLPALTAPNLTNLNRLAEQTYRDSGSLDEALLSLVQGFDEYARSKYPPYRAPTPAPISIDLPQLLPSGILGVMVLCCLLCLVMLIVMLVLWLLLQFARMGLFRSGRRSGSFGGFSGRRSSGVGLPRMRFPSGGGFPRTRGGGGSGRSGRGN